ncbi:MAG: chorismate synthase [Acidilobaceae archaeon]
MPGNTFGRVFKITTFGESHGRAVGVVIDGVPAGLPISEEDIEFELSLRRPGSLYTSPRREEDKPQIISGVFNGRTTGAPIAIVIANIDVDSKAYEEIKFKPRPGHADLSYIMKYGWENWDYRGGGRASGRETVARVAAGAIAKKLLAAISTFVAGHLRALGPYEVSFEPSFEEVLCSRRSPVRACRGDVEELFIKAIEEVMRDGDSLGGVVEVYVKNPPPGLGEPVFDKIKADLAKALMSIPGVVGFEYGLGFKASKMRGSQVVDEIVLKDNKKLGWKYNFSGGILGGLTTGEDIVVRCAFKPTSSIGRPLKTVDLRTMEKTELIIGGRHDPVIAIRGVAVAEAMVALVLVDHALRAGVISSTRLTAKEVETLEENWKRYREACGLSRESL